MAATQGHRRRAPMMALPLLLALVVVAGVLVRSTHAWVRPPPARSAATGAPAGSRHARRIGAASAAPLIVQQQQKELGRRTVVAAMAAAEGADAAGPGTASSYDVDVAIIGGGPAGSVMVRAGVWELQV
jgi:hypothetical protein